MLFYDVIILRLNIRYSIKILNINEWNEKCVWF